jgi:hypothetical protein
MRRLLPDYTRMGLTGYSKGWLDEYRDAWNLLRLEDRELVIEEEPL